MFVLSKSGCLFLKYLYNFKMVHVFKQSILVFVKIIFFLYKRNGKGGKYKKENKWKQKKIKKIKREVHQGDSVLFWPGWWKLWGHDIPLQERFKDIFFHILWMGLSLFRRCLTVRTKPFCFILPLSQQAFAEFCSL